MGGLPMTNNPFLQLAEQQMPAATKAKHRAREKREAKLVVQSEKDAPMKLSDMEQAQADQSKQFRNWKAFHRAESEAVLHGPNGNEYREMLRSVRSAAIDDPDVILHAVRSAKWLHGADSKTRQVALSAIASAIVRLRKVNGYAPFDDSLPGEEPTLFEIIRKELGLLT